MRSLRFGLPRDHDYGREPRRRIGLEPPADLQAIQARHLDVEQDHVRPVTLDRVEGGPTVGSAHHVVTIRTEQTLEERSDALRVVGDEHAAAPGDLETLDHDACSNESSSAVRGPLGMRWWRPWRSSCR